MCRCWFWCRWTSFITFLLPIFNTNNNCKLPSDFPPPKTNLNIFQLFVYLFAPLCHQLKESDFQHIRLENGLKMWQPLWEFRHPEATCFTAYCKPKPKLLACNKTAKGQNQFFDIFLGSTYKNYDLNPDFNSWFFFREAINRWCINCRKSTKSKSVHDRAIFVFIQYCDYNNY